MKDKNVLNIKSLKLSYFNNNEEVQALKSIDFYLEPNEIVSIIGQSGSGKTSLIKYIMQLNKSNTKVDVENYYLNGINISEEPNRIEKMLGDYIAMVLQDPTSSLNPTVKIGRQFKIVLKEKYPKITKIEMHKKISELFNEINIENYEEVINKYPAELSGGMNQRINIALSLIKEPQILILDEPTSAIDADNREKMIQLIKSIQNKRKISVIFVTHDIVLATSIADRVVVMKDGIIIESATKTAQKPAFEFTNKYVKQLYEDAMLTIKNNKKNNSEKIIEFVNVTKQFGKNVVLDNKNIVLYKGETLGFIGQSGSGKTTACKLIMGIYYPTLGKVDIDENINIEMVFQSASMSMNPKQPIFKILNEENYINKTKEYSEEHIIKYFEDFNLPKEVLNRNITELSGGQKQLISIIRALLSKPDVIILDEPTSSLDVTTQKNILDLLKQVKKKYNLTYIIISHNKQVIEYMCDRCETF